MNHMGSPPLLATESLNPTKRKRSFSNEPQPIPHKSSKTHSNHLQINYLARQSQDVLPLIAPEDDSLPTLLSVLTAYDGVLQRHESMAGNLGAKQISRMLIERLDRLFDGPPRVLKANGREDVTVNWLDVVDFERAKPEQFKLEAVRDGVKVCQFYTKQCRVEISEDDYLFIKTHRPRHFCPSQLFEKDEEQELGTLEILEKALGSCVQLADQVAGRARHLNHKLKNRKSAIIARREAAVEDSARGSALASVPRTSDYGHSRNHGNGERSSDSPTRGGFVAVNSQQSSHDRSPPNGSAYEQRRLSNAQVNGTVASHSASALTRAELLSKFRTKSERSNSAVESHSSYNSQASRAAAPSSKTNPKPYADSMEYAGVLLNTASPVPIPNTPSSLLPYVKPSPADRFDDSGPFKADMMARMEQLNRGDRVQPPCDRCRRLHMDCLKNLTACQGCTKKHAKCSWKDVEEQELKDHPFVLRVRTAEEMAELERSEGEGSRSGGEAFKIPSKTELQEVRDEELLGEETEEDGDFRIPKIMDSARRKSVNLAEIRELHRTVKAQMEASISQNVQDVPATLSPMSRSLGATTSTFDIIRDTNPSEPSLPQRESAPHTPLTTYQAPQAQMHRLPSFERHTSNGSIKANGVNDHAQSDYEKDLYLYSQLSEARDSAQQDQPATSAPPPMISAPAVSNASSFHPHEDPVRVYTAGVGSEAPQADTPPAQAPVFPAVNGSYEDTMPRMSTKEIEKPQMPSPPLSSVPGQTKSTPGTPGGEQRSEFGQPNNQT